MSDKPIAQLDNWKVNDDDSLSGVVTGHPHTEDGSTITTSPVDLPEDLVAGSLVETEDVTYELGEQAEEEA